MSLVYENLNDLVDALICKTTQQKQNVKQLKLLYSALELYKKVDTFEDIFNFSAINVMAISLDESNLGAVVEDKYVQLLAILPKDETRKKSSNISLGYYGKAKLLDKQLKNIIVEFVLRWRYEKAFRNLARHQMLIEQFNGLHDDASQ